MRRVAENFIRLEHIFLAAPVQWEQAKINCKYLCLFMVFHEILLLEEPAWLDAPLISAWPEDVICVK